ncbi:MAG: ABC transporter ATP-binding protein/permease [Paracoccaceae bacterium]|nr:ABC transporter ATP-binding protein/permease [Paracoccaceae bacterium]MDE2916706.1 ABC transporter ATP-binding protein/permease [Paracoccaceae bacterium]
MNETVESREAQARKSGMRILRRVTPFLWPKNNPAFRLRIVLALLALLTAELITVGIPFIYKGAVDSLTSGEAIDIAEIVAIGAVTLTIAYGVARVMSVLFHQLRDVIFAKVGQRALRTIALETFKHIHNLSLRYHITRKTGGLSRIVERGVKGVDWLLRFVLFSIGPLLLQLLMVCTVLWIVLGFWYFATILIAISLYVVFTFKVTEWRVQIRKEMNKQDTDANQKAIDSLLNYETVKYFGAEEREAQRYDRSMEKFETASLKTTYSLAALNLGQSVIITTGTVIVMLMAAIGVKNGELSVGDFVLVNSYMIQVAMPLNWLGTVYREIRQALVDMGEMFDLLDAPYEVSDRPDAKPLEVSGGKIEFKNVSFSYYTNRPILKGVNLTINPGETVAIVGPSGSGKSTIGRLLFRFYDVTEGALTIDNQDIRHVTQSSLHKQIGIVPQDTVLFNETIFYNIAYGLPDPNPRQVEEAARSARLHDFITELPEGYETQVGERGLKLSGGEKQRVGIARTLLKNPPIVLLDEATSSLDTETEKEIQDSFNEMSFGRTVIAIAHRLSTIVHSDKIIVLEQGEIVEKGTHEELLELHDKYYAMWHRQLAGEEDQEEELRA